MKIEKAVWTTQGQNISLAVPITKLNVRRRTVSGFATLDNVDEHGDIVTAEASREAFALFRGNIREQHTSEAVGKLVDVQERDYVAPDGNVYKGIYVTAYISEGAPSTWKKVTEGVLTGFSIGGSMLQSEVRKHNGRMVKVITKYRLHELSLVDNPANQLANIESFTKVIGFTETSEGIQASGIAANVRSEHVFYCPEDRIVLTEAAEAKDCEVCDTSMQKIGWFEYTDEASRENAVKESVKKFLDGGEGGVEMSQEKPEETVEPEVVETPQEVVEEPQEQEETEKVETVDEVVEIDVQKMLEETKELAEKLTKTVERLGDNHGEVSKTVEAIRGEVETLTKSVDEKFNEFAERFAALEEEGKRITEKVNGLSEGYEAMQKDMSGVRENVEAVQKEVASVQSATAVRKSSDLGGSDSVVRKSSEGLWGGLIYDVEES